MPPDTVPTLTVTPRAGSVRASARSIQRAIARIALAPRWWALPAWAALPVASTVTVPVPLRRVMIASPARPASNTSATAAPRAAAASHRALSGDPTSSSATTAIVSGTLPSASTSCSARSANAITTRPPFMSSTPGPNPTSPSER